MASTSDKNTREDFNYQAAIDKIASSVVTDDVIKRYPDSKFIDSEYSESYLAYNVYEDFDCTLVRTDLGKELVNEFYILQIIYEEDLCSVWTRTGKIGEVGKYNNENFGLRLGEAIDYFESKYKDLTGYTWSDTKGGNRLPSPCSCSGKYTPVQFKYDNEIQLKENLGKLHNILSDDGAAKMTKTTLVQPTLDLVQLIFTEDHLYKKLTRFDLYEGNERMKKFEIGLKGVEYIPLGIPTNTQLIKGLSLLKEIGDHIIHHATTEQHRQLSSDFYRTVPCLIEHVERAVIDDTGKVKQLRDVILVLGGVTNCLKTVDDAKENKGGIIPHPLDAHHKDVVKCKIEHLSDTSDEYKGEVGKYNNENFGLRLGEAIDYFESKYKDLTGYTWSDTKGGNRLPSPCSCSGKYTPVQFKYDNEIQLKENLGKLHNILSDDGAAKMTKTTLVQPTLDLVQLIFTEDHLYKKLTRFDLYEGNERMKKFEIGLKGVEYIPLGIPTNTQLVKGLSLLKEIGDHIIHHATTEQYRQLSSDFYRTVPCLIEHVERAVIDDTGKVKQLRDVILVLGSVTNCLKTVDEAKVWS
nr:protein mono-ADP-ribosyltransferase PARP3-like [Lytechinus pictus]